MALWGCWPTRVSHWERVIEEIYGKDFHILPSFEMGKDIKVGAYGTESQIARGTAAGNIFDNDVGCPRQRGVTREITVQCALQGDNKWASSVDFEVASVVDGKVRLQAKGKNLKLLKLSLTNVRRWDVTDDLGFVEDLLAAKPGKYKNKYFVLQIIVADVARFHVQRLDSGMVDLELNGNLPAPPAVGDVLRIGEDGDLDFGWLMRTETLTRIERMSNVMLCYRRFQYRVPWLISWLSFLSGRPITPMQGREMGWLVEDRRKW